MSKKEILEELKKLTPAERLFVIEAALQELRGEIQQTEPPPSKEERKRKLASAAEALFADYAVDGELTAFSVLDGEDFHAWGEVWLINLEPTVGAEIRKTKPAVIVNDDFGGITAAEGDRAHHEWKDRYGVAPWIVQVLPSSENGLDKLSAADAFQVRSLDHQRFVRKLGQLSDAVMWSISKALATVLSIE